MVHLGAFFFKLISYEMFCENVYIAMMFNWEKNKSIISVYILFFLYMAF